uniref:UDP-2,3-diacylglucosamine diphosphatase n=1 Tax=uncultured Campylobacter sp. TaxID=218934 RepID=UPI002603CC88
MQNDQIQTIKPGAIFIGDAHAGASRPQFLKFLRALRSAQSLPPQIFMMGDMFDFLANTTYVRRFYEEEIALINELSQKCEIFYFEGNHDFNLREIFPCAKVYPNAAQPVKFICESGEAVQIAHGDLFLPRLTQLALLSLRNRAFLKFMDLLDRALKFKISKMILKSQEGKNLYKKMPNFKDIIAPKIDFYAANLIIEGHYHQDEILY